MADTYIPIATQTLTSTAATVTFSAIPTTYTDLRVVIQTPTTGDLTYTLNGDSTTKYSATWLYVYSSFGSTRTTNATNNNLNWGANNGYFGTLDILNYSNSTTYKTILLKDALNGTASDIAVQMYRSTSPITSITFAAPSVYAIGTVISIYGITAGTATFTGTTKATGGTITKDSFGYVYHTFTSTNTFTPTSTISNAEILTVAGGGSGGWPYAGGGGGGGVLYTSGLTLANAVALTCTVGGGAAGSYGSLGAKGNDSSVTGSGFTTLTATGGGAGIARNTFTLGQQNGGSGGGGGNTVFTGGTGIVGQGFAGGLGSGSGQPNDEHGGGGGGAGSAGLNASTTAAGAGGAGTNAFANWAITTGTGSSQCYGGGGGGGTNQSYEGAGGIGGGGKGANNQSFGSFESGAGVANTGGGSGGGAAGNAPSSPKNGGSGIVIVRYLGV